MWRLRRSSGQVLASRQRIAARKLLPLSQFPTSFVRTRLQLAILHLALSPPLSIISLFPFITIAFSISTVSIHPLVPATHGRSSEQSDEKLSYAVALTLPSSAFADPESDIASADPSSRSSGAGSMPTELRTLARNVQLTATASFLPPQQRRPDPRLSIPAQNRLSAASVGSLAPNAP